MQLLLIQSLIGSIIINIENISTAYME